MSPVLFIDFNDKLRVWPFNDDLEEFVNYTTQTV